MNNQHQDVIGSLGKALSSVNIEAEPTGNGTNTNSTNNAGTTTNSGGPPGLQQQGSYGALGTAVASQQQSGGSWSGLSASAAPAPGGLSYNFYPNSSNNSSGNSSVNNSVHQRSGPTNTVKSTEHDSLQNILYDSGIYEKEEVASHRRASTTGQPGTTAPVPVSCTTPPLERERKPSIDIFLSRSPSKTLGEDIAFRVMNRTASNPSVNKQQVQQQQYDYNGSMPTNANNGLGKPLASTAPSSRSESPQTVRSNSGGMSSQASPYNAHGRQMYPSQFVNNTTTATATAAGVASTNFPPSGQHQQHHHHQQQHGQLHNQLGQQPSLSSQYPNSSTNIPGIVSNNGQQQQQQYVMPVQQQQQAPQVFYMAVPAPDGKGQVLQPVQMMQMPGQAGTLMMPMAGGVNNGNQGSNDNNNNVGANVTGNPQGMMLMQPVGNNAMYGGQVDNLGNSNNQYQHPYGNAMQQHSSGGYNDGRYQNKNTMDNTNGGHLGGYNQGNTIDQGNNDGTLDQVPTGSLSMLYSSPQRPSLRALLGNVRRLSRDQVGCRLLQQALDEDGPAAATAILNEGLTFWAEAMVDPFGNYLFQKILERIAPEERVILVSSVSTRLVNASLNLHGTRSVQKIVEVCAVDEEENEENDQIDSEIKEEESKESEQEAANITKGKKGKKKKETAAKILTDALKPSAARLCIDSHGNHAIQRILLKLPYQYTQFIFDAVAASVEDVARHRHGCCVIQRCLDSRHSAARTHLVTRIVEKSLELMQDAYGNYVVQYVLDVCGDDEVHAICESVIGKVCLLAIQKFSSNVMEKCLERCTDRVREEYLNELNDSDSIRELMMDPFGNYVVQRALSVSTHAQAIRLVETMKPHLSTQNGGGIRNTAGGRRILGKICRRFPNFVLEGETFEDYDLNQVLSRGSTHHGNQGGGGGGGRRQNNQFGMHPHPGPSPNHRRNNRNRNQQQHQQQHIPQYQQPQQQQQPLGQQHVNVQQSDINVMPVYQPQGGGNPYLFPQSM